MIGSDHRLLAGAACLVLAALTVMSGGCATARHPVVSGGIQPFTPAEIALQEAARNARYRIRVGDTFTVDFKYQDELDQHHVTVLPDGRFTMAGLEDVRAIGMTIPEVDSLITTSFARDYRNPELSVIMEELGKQHVYVLGEVRVPGMYELPPTGRGVTQAVAMAGGFLGAAAPGQTLIIRVTEAGYQYRRCDLSHLEKQGLRDVAALDLQACDIVYVPRSAAGDIAFFTENVLGSLIDLGGLFWDVYAITHLDRVNVITR